MPTISLRPALFIQGIPTNAPGPGLTGVRSARSLPLPPLPTRDSLHATMDPARARETFRQLHQSGCFVIPNPWDVGSARYLARLGFRALATTSSGFAWSRGRADNGISVDDALRHFEDVARSVDIPVNGDFEGGFAVDPSQVAANVRRAAATGISGISIEDSTGEAASPLFEFGLALERVRAAREAVAGTGVLLTARSEGFIVGRPDLDATLERLTAYAEAGADCLFAPGIKTKDEVSAVVRAVAPKPVNVLVGGSHTTVAELTQLGVRRISVGGALARTAWVGFMNAASEIARDGTFQGLASAAPFAEVNALFERR
jgi:2-methylisocitrate lyase-like PEP mutase family enzyme